jgi:IS30 family transposase
MQPYQHFTLTERESLSEKLKEQKSIRQIAKEMNRSPSTISREVKRNWSKTTNRYHPWHATTNYLHRRKACIRKTVLADPEKNRFVCEGLDKFWSPEAISARWKQAGGKGLSHSTIYLAIKKKRIPGYTGKTHLRRRGKRKNVHNTKVIYPVHTIHDRPKDVELRDRLGDLEGDTIYGAIGKGSLVTLVDRASRCLYAACIPNRDSNIVKEAFATALEGVSVNSITLDNGSEFAKFAEIEKQHNTTIYFADPHSPWQRGSIENINDVLRFFYPKGTNFLLVSQDELQKTLDLINNRPRKCLDWLSPGEFISYMCCT